MINVGIDVGPKSSAIACYSFISGERFVENFGIVENQNLDDWMDIYLQGSNYRFAIEVIASYGQRVGSEVFHTCEWCGCIAQHVSRLGPVIRVSRRQVVAHLTGGSMAKGSDAIVRAELIELFGGQSLAIGTSKSPGPLKGVVKDIWAALGVAVTAEELFSCDKGSDFQVLRTTGPVSATPAFVV